MKTYDVQDVSINASFGKVFNYIADPANLPKWTAAFKRADEHSALLATPAGVLEVGLEVKKDLKFGTVDWYMTLPSGEVAAAYSRLVPQGTSTIYIFALMAPPGPIEEVEGTLAVQIKLLQQELLNLKHHLER